MRGGLLLGRRASAGKRSAARTRPGLELATDATVSASTPMNREDATGWASAQPAGQRPEAIRGQVAVRAEAGGGCDGLGVHPMNCEADVSCGSV